LRCKSHVNAHDSEGNITLHVFTLDSFECDMRKKRSEKFTFGLNQEVTKRQLELCKLLLNAGVDLSLQNKVYETSLYRAVIANNVTIVESLISVKVDVNVCDENGWTALHFATLKGYSDIVNVLLEVKEDVMMRNLGECSTALHLAVKIKGKTNTQVSYDMSML